MKATFRLPDPLYDELRRLSEAEGQSLNATAIRVLRRGIGSTAIEPGLEEILGPFVARRASARYDPGVLARLDPPAAGRDVGLVEALEWVRGER